MRKIICVSNQKGGVGKTTTSINLASALANSSRNVLLIDMDPQGNASRGVGVDITLINKCIYDVLASGVDINTVIRKTIVKNLDVLPSKLILASIDSSALIKNDQPYSLLKDAIANIKKEYDYIIIDCPPSLGFLTLNALSASTSVLIPVQCEYFAMEAVAQILATVSKVQSSYNRDSKTRLCVEISMQIRGLFKENTFLTQIPRNVSIPESNVKGMPVTMHRPTSSGALAYFALAKEVMDHEER